MELWVNYVEKENVPPSPRSGSSSFRPASRDDLVAAVRQLEGVEWEWRCGESTGHEPDGWFCDSAVPKDQLSEGCRWVLVVPLADEEDEK